MIQPLAAATRRTVLRQAAQPLQRRLASGGPSYNQPSGRLFGEAPLKPGQKRQKEEWEGLWMYGLLGGMVVFGVFMYYQPDTRITTWAGIEARKRLDESGEPWKYEPSPNSGYPNGLPAAASKDK